MHLIKNNNISKYEMDRMIFGEPSVQTGDAISRSEVSDELFNNEEIKKQFSTREYERIIAEAKDAKPYFVNYGCYGKDKEYYVVEFYQFKNKQHVGEILNVVIAKEFNCQIIDKNKKIKDLTEKDLILNFTGNILSDSFIGSYTAETAQTIKVKDKEIELFKDIKVNTSPTTFYLQQLKKH